MQYNKIIPPFVKDSPCRAAHRGSDGRPAEPESSRDTRRADPAGSSHYNIQQKSTAVEHHAIFLLIRVHVMSWSKSHDVYPSTILRSRAARHTGVNSLASWDTELRRSAAERLTSPNCGPSFSRTNSFN